MAKAKSLYDYLNGLKDDYIEDFDFFFNYFKWAGYEEVTINQIIYKGLGLIAKGISLKAAAPLFKRGGCITFNNPDNRHANAVNPLHEPSLQECIIYGDNKNFQFIIFFERDPDLVIKGGYQKDFMDQYPAEARHIIESKSPGIYRISGKLHSKYLKYVYFRYPKGRLFAFKGFKIN